MSDEEIIGVTRERPDSASERTTSCGALSRPRRRRTVCMIAPNPVLSGCVREQPQLDYGVVCLGLLASGVTPNEGISLARLGFV